MTSEKVETVQKVVCSHCGEELDEIECRSSSWLEWSEEDQCYCWNDPWDGGSYFCPKCDTGINEDVPAHVILTALR